MVCEGSVGFLRVRPVIHPLFWANPLNQASEDPGAVGDHGFHSSAFLSCARALASDREGSVSWGACGCLRESNWPWLTRWTLTGCQLHRVDAHHGAR